MLNKQIHPDISKQQIEQLKSHNAKIFNYLEKNLPLERSILKELEAELTGIINANAEFCEVLKNIKNSGDYYHVQLLHPDNEILNLPWTLAVDNISKQPLGDIQQLLLSKCPPEFLKAEKIQPPQIAPPLKILIMISSPEDSDTEERLSFEDEEFRILKAFEPLMQSGQVEIDFTDDGSLEALERKIKKNK